MIKKILILTMLLANVLFAKQITPSEVFGQVMLISDEVHNLIAYYGIDHDHEAIQKATHVKTNLKPRNVWQKTYEIMIKINLLRANHKLPIMEPVNMVPVLNLNPDLVYEQTQRILTELKIFELRMGIKSANTKLKVFKGKTPMDVFNGLSAISAAIDEINKGGVTPSYVFGENMRVLDDITNILDKLGIEDKTIPAQKNTNATPTNTFNTGILSLEKMKQLQIASGIDFVDFNAFKKLKQTPSEVFSITQMIIAELQTIKAYLAIKEITPPANQYKTKTPIEVDQLMSWNLRKLNLIKTLSIKGK